MKGRTTEEVLKKMEKVYSFIHEYTKKHDYSPTIREICKYCNIPSTGGAFYYVDKLIKQGRLKQSNLQTRVFTPIYYQQNCVKVPVIGKIKTENTSIFDEINLEGVFPLPTEFESERDCFAFKVTDDYMANSGFMKNDTAICKKFSNFSGGDLAVVILNGEPKIRRVYNVNCKLITRTDYDGEVIETPIGPNENIIGKVIGITRKL